MRGIALYVVKRWAFRLSLVIAGLLLAWAVGVADTRAADESPSPSPTPTPTPAATPTPTPTPSPDATDAILQDGFATLQVGTYVIVAILSATLVLHLRPR
jgi:hypothetical protein